MPRGIPRAGIFRGNFISRFLVMPRRWTALEATLSGAVLARSHQIPFLFRSFQVKHMDTAVVNNLSFAAPPVALFAGSGVHPGFAGGAALLLWMKL